MIFNKKLLILTALIALSACDGKPEGAPAAGGMAGAGGPPPVTIAQPLVTSVDQSREFSGRFEATESIEIRSRVNGYLTKILFEEGSIVKKGDPLFVIDPRQTEAALRQRQADLKVAQSKVAVTLSDYERAKSLFDSGDVSQALLDQRVAARDSALAAVASAKAGVDAAQVDLVYSRIAAPITGRISDKQVSEGNLVQAGQTVLTTIVSMDPIYFTFDIDEKTYIAYTRNNPDGATAPVSIALSDEAEYSHAGKLDFIDNVIDPSTGTMRARAVLDNKDMVITPGMFGRVKLRIGGDENGILIPDSAITIDQSRKLVYVVNDKNIVETRTIETSGMDKGKRIITSGLKGDEWLVIDGLQRAHEGAPVTPQKEGAQNAAQPKEGAQ